MPDGIQEGNPAPEQQTGVDGGQETRTVPEAKFTQDQLDDIISARLAKQERQLEAKFKANTDDSLKGLLDSLDNDTLTTIGYTPKENLEERANRIAQDKIKDTLKQAEQMKEAAVKIQQDAATNQFKALMKAKGATDKAIERESRGFLTDIGFDTETGQSAKSVSDYVDELYADSDLSYLFPNKGTPTTKAGTPNKTGIASTQTSGDLLSWAEWAGLDADAQDVYTRKNGMKWA